MNDSNWFVTEHPISLVIWAAAAAYLGAAMLFGLT